LLLIDNGSRDESVDVLLQFKQQAPQKTEVLLNNRNLHHGPAMDQALQRLKSPYALFLDSDCEVMRGGFIELMLDLLEGGPHRYVVGKLIFMNDRGFDLPEGQRGHPYIRPICMLVRRKLYLTLPPFTRHGTPCFRNMVQAVANGLELIHFPVDDYVFHEGRGTARRHGYGLGWRSRLDYLLNKAGL
jgi:glycosyltransferase involved in cell wall biosynthesis